MKYKSISILLLDKDRNTVELELDSGLYRMLGIKAENIKKHKKRVDLNQTVTEFLNKADKNI